MLLVSIDVHKKSGQYMWSDVTVEVPFAPKVKPSNTAFAGATCS